MPLCRDMIDTWMSMVDRSNWPCDLKGYEFKGYERAMEHLQELLEEYQQAAYNSCPRQPPAQVG